MYRSIRFFYDLRMIIQILSHLISFLFFLNYTRQPIFLCLSFPVSGSHCTPVQQGAALHFQLVACLQESQQRMWQPNIAAAYGQLTKVAVTISRFCICCSLVSTTELKGKTLKCIYAAVSQTLFPSFYSFQCQVKRVYEIQIANVESSLVKATFKLNRLRLSCLAFLISDIYNSAVDIDLLQSALSLIGAINQTLFMIQ